MRWSIKLGTFFGIDIKVHLTFFLLLGWIVWSAWVGTHELAAVVGMLVFVACLFSSVVLHELGHALVARRYGIPTRDITLLPIGGVARIERMPSDPRQELAIAIAGPIVSVLLAAAAFAIAWLVGDLDTAATTELLEGSLLVQLAVVNASLAVFNMLPAFPMDGGRIVRALLAMKLGPMRATEIAARLGQALALGLGVLGLWANPVLVLIAIFVWLGASGERQASQLDAALRDVNVAAAVNHHVLVLAPDDPLAIAVRAAEHGIQPDFPVVQGHRLIGMLTHQDLLRALAEAGPAMRVAEAMSTDIAVVHPGDALSDAHRELARRAMSSLPVVDARGDFIGMLTIDSIAERFMIDRALRMHQQRAA